MQTDDNKSSKLDQAAALISLVARIEVQRTQLTISLKQSERSSDAEVLPTAWQKPPSKRFRKILLPHGTVRETIRPERAERRARLVYAITRGRRWLDEILKGSVLDGDSSGESDGTVISHSQVIVSLGLPIENR